MNWRRCLLCAFNEAREDRFNAKSTSSFLFLRCFLFLLSPLARLVQYTCISLSCYFWDHSTNNFRYFSKYYCSINTSTINGYKYLCSHIVCPNEQACQCEVISFFWCSPLYIPCSLKTGIFWVMMILGWKDCPTSTCTRLTLCRWDAIPPRCTTLKWTQDGNQCLCKPVSFTKRSPSSAHFTTWHHISNNSETRV